MAEPVHTKADPKLTAALYAVAATGALMAVAAWLVWEGRAAFSVAVGCAIALSNLYVLSRIVGRMLGGSPSEGGTGGGGAAAWGVFAAVKMIVLFGVIWLLMAKKVVMPLGLLVGYMSLPIGIAIGTVVSDKTDPGH